ncbi:MAG: hypothetical protein ABSD98_06375 [Candidatus Korobacteraceae bacterium]|jgi:hypothetical protein
MWKDVGIGLAINFLAAAFIYTYKGPSPAIVLFLVGLAIIGAVILFEKRKSTGTGKLSESTPSNSSTTNQDSFRQEFNPTFNPTFSPSITINPSPNPPPSPTPISVRAIPRQEEPKHNLVFLGATFVKLAYSGPGFSRATDGMHSLSEVVGTSRGDMIGLVARFRNEAVFGQDIKAIRRARAHLKLFDKNSREIGTGFSAALWLGHPDDTFDLIPNARGGSVLVCWGTKTKAKVSWKTRVAVDRLRDHEIELSDGYPSRAEVTIMDSNDRPLLEPIILEITKTKGELSVTALVSRR